MDATRSRRTRDSARRAWYADWRCRRFARHLGFPSTPEATNSQGGPAPAHREPVPGRAQPGRAA
jgi:hypothetical protein